jgi:hypothetical protein
VKQRRKFVNEISDLGLMKVCSLIGFARNTTKPTPTAVLLRQSGLEGDAHTSRGALKMAEVLGLVHATRGERKALLWQGGRATSERDQGLPVLLPFRHLRDLLQYYRSSLIGTPDLLRDADVTNQREGLGALKALHALGCVEIGKLNPQTVAWRWVDGRGESRTYQRDHFKRERAPAVFEDEAVCEGGTLRWPWIHEVIHREWLLQTQADGFGELAETDGFRRYRPLSDADQRFNSVLVDAFRQMPERRRHALVATLIRGWKPEEAAKRLGVSVSTLRRDTEAGLVLLRCVLTEAGFAPSIRTMRRNHRADLARCA